MAKLASDLDQDTVTDRSLPKAPTGITGLDEILGGGLPQGRPKEAAEVVGAERRGVPKAKPGGPLHILLAEDHLDTAQALAALLEGLGHRITVAGTVAGALAAAEVAGTTEPPIELVISDLGLPDGSGLDLMRELSSRYRLAGIALSGYGMEEDVQKSRDAGFARHLTKPVTLDVLKDVIDQVREESPSP